jgi:hypothetical protein
LSLLRFPLNYSAGPSKPAEHVGHGSSQTRGTALQSIAVTGSSERESALAKREAELSKREAALALREAELGITNNWPMCARPRRCRPGQPAAAGETWPCV